MSEFQPASFKSSRGSRAEHVKQHASQFMDDKDGILGGHLATREEFRSFDVYSGKSERRTSDSRGGGGDSFEPLLDVVGSDFGQSIAKKMLETMGWKEGQAVGKRLPKANAIATIDDDESLIVPVGANISAIPKAAFDSATGLLTASNATTIQYAAHPPKKYDRHGAGFEGGLGSDPSVRSYLAATNTFGSSMDGGNGEQIKYTRTALLGSAGGYLTGGGGDGGETGKSSAFRSGIKRGLDGFALDDAEDDVYDDSGYSSIQGNDNSLDMGIMRDAKSLRGGGDTLSQRALGYDYSIASRGTEANEQGDEGGVGGKGAAISNQHIAKVASIQWHDDNLSLQDAGLQERYPSDHGVVLPGFTLPKKAEKVLEVEETPLVVPATFQPVHVWGLSRRSRFASASTSASAGIPGDITVEQVYSAAASPPLPSSSHTEEPTNVLSEEVLNFVAAISDYIHSSMKAAPLYQDAGAALPAATGAAAGLQSRFSIGKSTLAQEGAPRREEKEDEEMLDGSTPGVLSASLQRKTSIWIPAALLLRRFRVKQEPPEANATTNKGMDMSQPQEQTLLRENKDASQKTDGTTSKTRRKPTPPVALLKSIFAPDETLSYPRARARAKGKEKGKEKVVGVSNAETTPGLGAEPFTSKEETEERGRIVFRKPSASRGARKAGTTASSLSFQEDFAGGDDEALTLKKKRKKI